MPDESSMPDPVMLGNKGKEALSQHCAVRTPLPPLNEACVASQDN